ncbi:hypothetical protein CEXT_58361 [Caerostris extrusa]|uniref:Uncharacterized protein n=1 Tax=Caerostris extrusa TaxID=172846 RepID=A0AAV4RZ60_CAEEX|nr:hypothetical protein CEXT_58361 [Caerostris extrusa]
MSVVYAFTIASPGDVAETKRLCLKDLQVPGDLRVGVQIKRKFESGWTNQSDQRSADARRSFCMRRLRPGPYPTHPLMTGSMSNVTRRSGRLGSSLSVLFSLHS